ncbi:MAG: hypothetical protein C5B57_08955 [Blastocatellia bacterium]|nr:MAG: hypothetical protein C5B57_08955 [Blastocatellia bacterium]
MREPRRHAVVRLGACEACLHRPSRVRQPNAAIVSPGISVPVFFNPFPIASLAKSKRTKALHGPHLVAARQFVRVDRARGA